MPKALVLIAVLAAAVAAGWYWQHRGAPAARPSDVLAQTTADTAGNSPRDSDAANRAEAAAEEVIAAAGSAPAATAAQDAEQGDPVETAPAFVDVEKMRDIVETSQTMPAEVKAEILQLLDAAAIDPSKLDAALVKYRAALQ